MTMRFQAKRAKYLNYCVIESMQQFKQYRVFQKTDPRICFCNNFGKCTPILILFHCYNKKIMSHKI